LSAFIEIFAAPLKLTSTDYIVVSAFLIVTGLLLLFYLNRLIKLSNTSLVKRYEKLNLDFVTGLNSVLTKYLTYSEELFKSYSACPQVYLQNISSSFFKAEQLSDKFTESFNYSETVFYSLNKSIVSSYKYLTTNVNGILNNSSLAFQAYSSSLADVNSHIIKLIAASDEALNASRRLKTYPESIQFKEAGDIILSFKDYIDKYSYLISSAETNFSTLQNLQTDELKHEVSLITGQLTENLKNYGISVNSALINVVDDFNISLNQFVNRSNEYISSLRNSLTATSVRKIYVINKNTVIIPVKIEKAGDMITAITAQSGTAKYFLIHDRNNYKLFPSDFNNEYFSLIFTLEGNEKTGKFSRIEPAQCRKLNDRTFELIKKGIIYFK
jgi:hypothetical protein